MTGLRVAVLMGGRSSEHEISLASARSVIEGLGQAGYEALPIEISREGRWQLPAADRAGQVRPLHRGGEATETDVGAGPVPPERQKEATRAVDTALPIFVNGSPPTALGEVDVVFPVLHGPFGEDGTVQGLLELMDVAYVGPGVAASALAMDKDLFKSVMRANDVPVARSATYRAPERPGVANSFGLPVVVKPARLGSSVGITVARTAEAFEQGVELAFAHDEKILVEEYVSGVEVECSVLGNEAPIASVPGEIVPLASDWYDYSAKYDDGGMELVVPARISPEQATRVQELAVRSFLASDCEGMARVDLFVDENGEVLVNELNTIPGFTATSVYAKLFAASGIPYPELLDRLVRLALARHRRRASLRY